MKKTISMILCLMILCVACISVASADSTTYSYVLWSCSCTASAPARAGWYARVSSLTITGTFRRADHLTGGGTQYTKTSPTKSSGYGGLGQASPSVSVSVSANNSADDFIKANVKYTFTYVK